MRRRAGDHVAATHVDHPLTARCQPRRKALHNARRRPCCECRGGVVPGPEVSPSLVGIRVPPRRTGSRRSVELAAGS